MSQLSVQEVCVQPTPPTALTGADDDTVGGAPWASGRVGTSSKPLADVTLHALCYSYRQTETGAASEQLSQRVTPALVPNTLLPSSTSPRAL